MLKEALGALRRGEVSDEEQLRCSLLAYRSAVDLWDDEIWYLLSNRYVELARAGGALPTLHFALNALIVAHCFAGERSRAHSLLAELRACVKSSEARYRLTPPWRSWLGEVQKPKPQP